MDFDRKYTGNPAFRSDTGCSDMDGVMETYGEDLVKVVEQNEKNPKTVWTIVDCDGELVIVAGYHWVNRFLYFVSNEEWENANEEYPWE